MFVVAIRIQKASNVAETFRKRVSKTVTLAQHATDKNYFVSDQFPSFLRALSRNRDSPLKSQKGQPNEKILAKILK